MPDGRIYAYCPSCCARDKSMPMKPLSRRKVVQLPDGRSVTTEVSIQMERRCGVAILRSYTMKSSQAIGKRADMLKESA